MLILRPWFVVLTIPLAAFAADNPRHIDLGPGLTAVKTLEQNWSDEESNWFYNVPQGSRLMPYEWFLHLEQAKSDERFADPNHIRALGYLARKPDPKNPDGLPIGFIEDAAYEDGTRGLGLTCAACHTCQITHKGTAFLIDGGQTLGDLERLMKELAAALAATARDDAKFARFAARLLPPDAAPDAKAALRASVRAVATTRAAYNKRNFSTLPQQRFGPGRIDAFGAIFNEVSVTFLGVPENVRPASAPVSYPCLWDAPQHDRVQWNGAAENRVSPLGELLVGTTDLGALGRNSGEVLGVFGHVEINAHELLIPRRYESSVNKDNLLAIENSLKTLWSPQWPDAFGKLDTDLIAKGAMVFAEHCSKCHKSIDRKDPDRRVKAQLASVGTDETMLKNFGRLASTGRLEGRRKTLLGLEHLAETEPVGVILKHVVERVILDPNLSPAQLKTALLAHARNKTPAELLDLLDELNPGFRQTATIDVGDKQLVGQFDSLTEGVESVSVGGGRFQLMDKNPDPLIESVGGEVVDLRSGEQIRSAAGRLSNIVAAAAPQDDAGHEQIKASLKQAKARIGYKARPLNGIWATAPYLHNGSVPNLVELLKPAAQRVKTFHVGSQEYDPVNVGFKDDPNQPLYDTRVPGNSNSGHEYGTTLTPQERRCLLEYLKSL